MSNPCPDAPDYRRVAHEFGLGRLLAAHPLAHGHPAVVKLTTELGQFVVKPASNPAEVELYERVAATLNQQGIRQAQQLRSTAGVLVCESGHTVQEFLPGQPHLAPTPAQTAAAMRHTGVYHQALRQVQVPQGLHAEATIWTRVASHDYLLQELPGLLERSGLSTSSQRLVNRALSKTEAWREPIARLPTQLVHGDIGPDNVLMNADRVVAIVDFTPFIKPVLFAVATAVYWYHVYGHHDLDIGAVRASVAAASDHRRLSSTEIACWPTMIMLEALRRLATALAVAAETGASVSGGRGPRYVAVRTLADAFG